MFIIYLFLTALLLVPVSIQLSNMKSVDIVDYLPSLEKIVDQPFVNQLNNYYKESNNNKDIEIQNSDEYYVVLSESVQEKSKIDKHHNSMIISKESVIIKEQNKPEVVIPYNHQDNLLTSKTPQMFLENLSDLWFKNNYTSIILVTGLNSILLLLMNNAIFILGASALLLLMKLSQRYNINSYKECVTIVLNSYGLPSFIAMMAGLINLNTLDMISLQGLLFVVMLILSYWQTHFNDEYVLTMESRGK